MWRKILLVWLLTITILATGRPQRAGAGEPAKDQGKGKPLLTLSGCPSYGLYRIAWSPNGKLIAAPRDPQRDRVFGSVVSAPVLIWDAATGKLRLTLKGHTRRVGQLCFSPDSKSLVTTADDQTARIWNTATGKNTLTIKTGPYKFLTGMNSATFSPDGKYVATGGRQKTISIWHAKSGSPFLTLSGHTKAVNDLSYSPDGKRLASASLDGSVRVWDSSTGKEVLALRDKQKDVYVYQVAFSVKGNRLASAAIPLGLRNDAIKIRDAASGKRLHTLQTYPSTKTYCLAFSPDGRWIAGADNVFGPGTHVLQNCRVKIWDTETGKSRWILAGHEREITDLVFSPGGKRLASASLDGTIKIWDVSDLMGK